MGNGLLDRLFMNIYAYKRCSTLTVVKEIQIKTTLRHQKILPERLKTLRLIIPSFGGNVEQPEISLN